MFYTSGRNGLWFIVSEPQQKMCHAKPSGNNGCRFAEKGYYMTVQENEKSEGKQVYVEGLKRVSETRDPRADRWGGRQRRNVGKAV